MHANCPSGPAALFAIETKAEADRQAAALAHMDWITADAANGPVVKFNNGAVPVNKATAPFGGPVVD